MFQVDVDYLKKAKKRKDHGKVVIIVVLTLAGAVSLLPLIYLFSTAFKPPEELFLYPPTFFVRNPTFQNFKDLTAITANSAAMIEEKEGTHAFAWMPTESMCFRFVICQSLSGFALRRLR